MCGRVSLRGVDQNHQAQTPNRSTEWSPLSQPVKAENTSAGLRALAGVHVEGERARRRSGRGNRWVQLAVPVRSVPGCGSGPVRFPADLPQQ